MNISIFGLGYVGVVTAACLAKEGHRVYGVDVAQAKADLINQGLSPIIEDRIGDLIREAVAGGMLSATTRASEALSQSDMAIVCVGTPSRPNGALDNQYVEQVVAEIGACLSGREQPLLIVMRSTMLPGTMHDLVLPTLEKASGRLAGDGYDVLFHPEFLREGSSVFDFYNPPKIVIGEFESGTAGPLLGLYGEKFDAPRIVCDVRVAEMVKYCDNLFHAVKVTFANEIGQLCHAIGVDSQEVMRIFCLDTKLNISHRYLKPGFAFGGSCLPKDMRAILAFAQTHTLNLPMLSGVIPSNLSQIERAIQMILATGAQSIGFHGIAFKEGTDDLRESPFIEVAERLLGKGKRLVCYDPLVQVSRLVGRNRSYVDTRFPHLAELLTDDASQLDGCDLVLVCHKPKDAILDAWRNNHRRLFDLTGFALHQSGIPYQAIV